MCLRDLEVISQSGQRRHYTEISNQLQAELFQSSFDEKKNPEFHFNPIKP